MLITKVCPVLRTIFILVFSTRYDRIRQILLALRTLEAAQHFNRVSSRWLTWVPLLASIRHNGKGSAPSWASHAGWLWCCPGYDLLLPCQYATHVKDDSALYSAPEGLNTKSKWGQRMVESNKLRHKLKGDTTTQITKALGSVIEGSLSAAVRTDTTVHETGTPILKYGESKLLSSVEKTEFMWVTHKHMAPSFYLILQRQEIILCVDL